jgi:alpha-L-fucosidase
MRCLLTMLMFFHIILTLALNKSRKKGSYMARKNGRARTQDRAAWWREARFGMFIHWGLYAVPAGVWKGKEIPSIGEWIMRNAKIPIQEYEGIAEKFNPVKFDADAWVKTAKAAGMKYIAITAKHHDGFAMFHSPSNPYNVKDATPWGRDPVMELSKACAKHGLKFCLYYSQSQDWHAPGGAGHWEEDGDKPWWTPSVAPEAFAKYLENVVKPQLRELLAQYGPIGVLWFDTPVVITEEQSRGLRNLVHELQPDCLVSGRVGNDAGDFGSLGDNEIPACPVKGDWETPATLNDTWGYKRNDHNWKSVRNLIFLLADLAGKGVNYLLNVGPDASGVIPKPCVSRLLKIGEWLKVNGDAVYGCSASPFPGEFEWGRVTAKGGKLYLLITKWGREIKINGLRNKIKSAKLPADPRRKIGVDRTHDSAADIHTLTLTLPGKSPDPYVSVLELELDGAPDVYTGPLQQPDGSMTLWPHMASLHPAADNPKFKLGDAGQISGWTETGSSLEWEFKLLSPGEFEALIVVKGPAYDSRGKAGKTGQKVVLDAGGMAVSGTLRDGGKMKGFRTEYHPEYGFKIGRLTLDKPGLVRAALRAEKIPAGSWGGLPLASVRLVPAAKKSVKKQNSRG